MGGGAPCAKGRRHLSSKRNSSCAKGDWERRGRGGRGVRAGVLIVSLRLALKNSKKESRKCRFSSNWQLNMELSFKAVHRPESLGGPMRFRLTALAPGFFDDKPEFVRLYVPIEDAKLERLLKGS